MKLLSLRKLQTPVLSVLASYYNQEVLTLWPALENILKTISDKKQLAFAVYNDIKMPSWHNQRIAFIGDCAHGMSPQLGQGANLGLLDALCLSECIAEKNDMRQAFAYYSKKRKGQIRYYQAASRFVTPWFQSSSRTMGLMRDYLHPIMCKTPFLKSSMLLTLACMKNGFLSHLPYDTFDDLRNLTQ